MATANSLLRWEHSPVTWAIQEPPSGLTYFEARDAAVAAFAVWEVVCGLAFRMAVDGAGYPDVAYANILIAASPIHGRMLAFSEKPGPAQIHIRFNLLLRWTNNPEEEKAIWFPRVLAHEIGHALGIVDHLPPPALMAGEYVQGGSKTIELMPTDIAEAVARYGPPG